MTTQTAETSVRAAVEVEAPIGEAFHAAGRACSRTSRRIGS